MSAPLRPDPTVLRRVTPMRRRRWRLLPGVAGALVKAVVLVGGPVALGWWMLTSPYFAITELQVGGGERVSAAWVAATLEPVRGQNLWRVELSGIQQRLQRHSWVEEVEMRREPPGRLVVRVVERVPAVVLADAEGPIYLDRQGDVIAPRVEGEAEQLLVVHAAPEHRPPPVERALEVVARLDRLRPGWGAAVDELTVLGEGEFRLDGEALVVPLLIRDETLTLGVERLERIWDEIEERVEVVEVVDLRRPGRIVVRLGTSASDAGPVSGSNATEG